MYFVCLYFETQAVGCIVYFCILRFRQVEYNCSEAMDILLDTKSVTIHWVADQHNELKLRYIIGDCLIIYLACNMSCGKTH